MNEPDLDPLDPELRSLLDVERARPPVAPQRRARVLSRLEASVLAGAVGVASGATAANAGGILGKTGLGKAGLGKAGAKGWLAIVLAFAVGGAVGAGATYAARTPAAERVVYLERRVEVAVPSPTVASPLPSDESVPLAQSAVPSALAAAPTAGPHPVSSAHPSPLPSMPSSMKAEQQAIDAIHAALMRKDSAAALDAVTVHETRFAKGEQVEEREALAVQALALSGRTAEAKARAARFLKTWPKSLFRANVEKVHSP